MHITFCMRIKHPTASTGATTIPNMKYICGTVLDKKGTLNITPKHSINYP